MSIDEVGWSKNCIHHKINCYPPKKSQLPLLVNNKMLTELRFHIYKRTRFKPRFQRSKEKFNPIFRAQYID